MRHCPKALASNAIWSDATNILLACFLAVFLLSTWKYAKDGDAYIFQTPATDQFVDLRGNAVSQDVIVDELADWNDRSYAVYFHFGAELDEKSRTDVNEKIRLELTQGGLFVDSAEVPVGWLGEGFNELKWLDFSRLGAGTYTLAISGMTSQPVCVGLCENAYNLPNCYENGEDTGRTLVQTYHYNYANLAYWAGIVLFVLLVAMSAATFWQCAVKGEGASGTLRLTLAASYVILAFEYDRNAFFQPVWAEAVTNFMHNSISQSWWKCLLITDAGYLPLVQRLIAILIFNVLNVSPYIGVFIMEYSAYALTGLILSFFAKRQFSSVLDVRLRWIVSILLMTVVLNRYSGYDANFFIDFIVFGVYVFFLYFLVDGGEWSRGEFAAICAWVFAQCLSKGVNVTLLPFCVLCWILFRRAFSKRDRAVLASCAAGAFLQLAYYVGYGADKISWVDRANSVGGEHYAAKLILSVLVDTPNWFLAPLLDKVTMLNGIAVPIIIAFWVLVGRVFFNGVAGRIRGGGAVKRETVAFLMAVIFIMAQSMFLRITLTGVSKSGILSDAFWSFQNIGVTRHTAHLFLAAVLAYMAVLHVLEHRRDEKKRIAAWAAILVVACIASPRMQLKGVLNDDYARASSYLANNNAEVMLLKGIREAECRIVPILPEGWRYGKNAALSGFGQDVFGWGAAMAESNEPQEGSLALGNYPNANAGVPIYQVFVCKNCLVGANKWQAILYDDSGNVLLRQEQDNTEYQKIASFTFDEGISGVGRIQIVDSEGCPVRMENAMYVVTKAGEPLVR